MNKKINCIEINADRISTISNSDFIIPDEKLIPFILMLQFRSSLSFRTSAL